MIKFKTTILQTGNNTGIIVPETVLEQLAAGKKPLVMVTLNGGHSYRSAIGKMGNHFLISLSAENRKLAGVNGGDHVEVSLQLDAAPRSVDVPQALQEALNKSATAQAAFDKLAPSKKKAMVLSITEAKTDDTRQRRIEKAIQSLEA